MFLNLLPILAAVSVSVILTYLLMRKHRYLRRRTSAEKDIFVIRRTTLTIVFGLLILGVGLLMTFVLENDNLMSLVYGVTILIVGAVLVLSFILERVEYSIKYISQYRLVRRNATVIVWNDVIAVNYRSAGKILEIRSVENKILIDFRYNGLIPLLEFMETQLPENIKILTLRAVEMM
jgi:hypothetical protein